MKQLIEIQSWTFRSISGEKKTWQEKQIISKILHSPAPVPISSCYSGCGQAIKWGSNTMGILICIFQIKGLSPHKFEGKAVCIHLSLCPDTEAFLVSRLHYAHAALSKRIPQIIAELLLHSIRSNCRSLWGHFRNIVYPARGE